MEKKYKSSKILNICLAVVCIVLALGLIFCLSYFTSNNQNQDEQKSKSTNTETARFLNFNPEVTKALQSAAEEYQKETGNTIIVDAAANGQYESTLAAKMTTEEAPTLFVIGGQKDLTTWKNYLTDITDSWPYNHLIDKNAALKSVDGKVYGVPYHNEGYGIIYNKNLLINILVCLTDQIILIPWMKLNHMINLKLLQKICKLEQTK